MDNRAVLRKCLWCALSALPVWAQDFSIDGIPAQVHVFASQGFALSNQNNYLTMDTSQGSFAFRDVGVNFSLQANDKLWLGAQAYDREIGSLGRGTATLDWAVVDYRFNDWIGIRAGKVKTTFGLYNDTQDVESLHTWAILPQSIYPLDLRGLLLAHLGGDVYGGIPLGKAGRLSYTGYAGRISENRTGGVAYTSEALGVVLNNIAGTEAGGDLRWNTPLRGALVGASFVRQTTLANGANELFGGYPYQTKTDVPITGFYGQYNFGKWRLDAEYGRQVFHYGVLGIYGPFSPAEYFFSRDQRAWYASLAYRLSKYVELGTYNSRFFPNDDRQYPPGFGYVAPVARHIFDQAATIRFDFKNHWDFKVEGHFIDGYGDRISFRGFYPQDNPQGLKPETDLLVLRLGFNL